ncbi:MAG: hypothetical protein LBS19_09355 [Clostridiales bacterium]|nr:hypothetical protein [Clostridiales bacterium]
MKAVLGKSWWYPNEHIGEANDPHVHVQYLPVSDVSSAEPDESKYFPLVQLVHISGEMDKSLDEAKQTVIILFGGWDGGADNNGWRIPSAMLWAVLQDLLNRPIIGGFKFVPPVEWSLPYNDNGPYYTASLTTAWECSHLIFENGPGRGAGTEEQVIHERK